jgi:hypothetical protein
LALAFHLVLAAPFVLAQRPSLGDPATATRSQPTGEDIEKALTRFGKLSVRAQEKALADVRAAVDAVDDPYLHSIRAVIAREVEKAAKPAKLAAKKPKAGSKGQRPEADGSLWQGVAFPVRQEYVFGRECVVACNAAAEKKSSRSKREAAARQAELRALLYGFPPDLDVALASLLSDLDRDRRADSLSRVLETWRDGEESFYRALDRTAGTAGSVFFYDAMLADFVQECVPADSQDRQRLHGSNDAAHDALHAAFLAYRQYRGLREAAVLALLLPPDQKLPGPLARYERDQPGGYSLREIVTLLLADAEQDIDRVVQLIVASAPGLPEDLWRGYEPLPALYAAFNERQAAMVARAGHTDRLLEEQSKRRAALHDQLARVAYDALPH